MWEGTHLVPSSCLSRSRLPPPPPFAKLLALPAWQSTPALLSWSRAFLAAMHQDQGQECRVEAGPRRPDCLLPTGLGLSNTPPQTPVHHVEGCGTARLVGPAQRKGQRLGGWFVEARVDGRLLRGCLTAPARRQNRKERGPHLLPASLPPQAPRTQVLRGLGRQHQASRVRTVPYAPPAAMWTGELPRGLGGLAPGPSNNPRGCPALSKGCRQMALASHGGGGGSAESHWLLRDQRGRVGTTCCSGVPTPSVKSRPEPGEEFSFDIKVTSQKLLFLAFFFKCTIQFLACSQSHAIGSGVKFLSRFVTPRGSPHPASRHSPCPDNSGHPSPQRHAACSLRVWLLSHLWAHV